MSSSEMKNPKDSLTLLPCFYFVELPIVASSMVSLYFLELTDVVQPAQVGFRCHDRELSMPYVDSGDELIPLLMLLSLAFSGPAASIMLVEALVYCLQSRLKLLRAEGSINAGGCNFNSFLRRTVRFVGVHVFGLCATALLTDVIQLSTGYHAPFFLTVCKPNYTMATSGACDSNGYIIKDICSGQDQHAILTARKTFPSQHATLSAFAAVYVSMYFNATISDSTKLLKPVLVFAFAIAAALTGLTQITQHRSHPIDVYAGFLIGAFVAGYLAFHAVGNFQSSDDITAVAPPPLKADALKALTERGHDSVYNKGPASASESHDDITAPGPIREADSMDLKRASVELLAPRSPMAKETMLTFSNTLPRASMAANGGLGPTIGHDETGQPVQPVAPVQRRLKAVPVPMDPTRSQNHTRTLDPVLSQLSLVSEWKQNLSREEPERDTSEESSETGTEEGPIYTTAMHAGRSDPSPVYQTAVHCGRSGSRRGTPTPPPGGAKPVATPRPPQVCDAPPVSPKSAMTRAKWLAIREKATGGEGATPRLMQVVAMTKQQQRLRPSSSSETGSTCSDSPHYGNQRHSDAIVTVDAHAPHHPVVKTTATPPNDSPRDVTPRQATPPNVIHRQATPPNVTHTHHHPVISPLPAQPAPPNTHRGATPPNVTHTQQALHRKTPPPNASHRGATPPNVIHRQATPPNVTHTHHHPVISPLPAQPAPPNTHRGATPPNVTHTQQALHRKTPPPNASHRGATPPNTLAPPLAPPPWEWAGSNGSDPRDSYDLNSLTRGDSAARGSSFRPASRSASPRDMGVAYSRDMGVAYSRDMGVAYSRDTSCMGVSYPEGEESPADAHRREMAMRRKTALVLLDREIRSQAQQETYYQSLQPRRYKD